MYKSAQYAYSRGLLATNSAAIIADITNVAILLAGISAALFVPIVVTVVYHEVLRRKCNAN